MFAASKTASVSGGYQISRSLRFNSADTTYLGRTPSTAGNRQIFTWSGWVKRSALTLANTLFGARNVGSNPYSDFYFSNTNVFVCDFGPDASRVTGGTTAVFRDTSAWYHVVVAVDTTQATDTNRVKVYINNQLFTLSAYPAQNLSTDVNNTVAHQMGRRDGGDQFLNGYMTEVNFIDGQQLTPSSFGETNAQTGVWQPKAYSGSYGTNGFYLNFSDNSNTTAATLGKDYSGNGNNWTPNGFLVSAGVNNDSLVDSPTSYGVDTGVGGTVRGNYATWNPLFTGGTLANGNLDFSATAIRTSLSTIALPTSGKWYWEVTVTAVGNSFQVGIGGALSSGTNYLGSSSDAYAYSANAVKYNNGSSTAYGASYTTNDVIAVAYDADAGTLVFYKNNTSQGTAFSSLSGTFFPAVSYGSSSGSGSCTINFGQRPFAYTAPSGFKALCTQNLPTPTIGATTATTADKFFAPVTFTSSATGSVTISSLGFQPDFTWWKSRATVVDHYLMDVLRGNSTYLASNRTLADQSYSNIWIPSSSGWTSNNGSYYNNDPNVAWNWKANGSGSSNTAGSITSTVSANTTSGFSVVTYTGTGANATVGHGLGVAPTIIFIKNRSTGSTNWVVYNLNATTAVPSARPMYLNTGNGEVANADIFNYPSTNTTTVFNIGTNAYVNTSSNNYVAYCWTPIAGYSAMNIFTGNGSADGPFVFCGFRPAYVLIKDTSNNGDWFIWDTARDAYNVSQYTLLADTNAAETSGSANYIDILSNGFKVKATTAGFNTNTDKFLFMAFASAPFKFSLAR